MSVPTAADELFGPLVHGTAQLQLRRIFQLVIDAVRIGVLVTTAAGRRTHSNRCLDALVGADGRIPLDSADPPVYLPADQHHLYWELLRSLPELVFSERPGRSTVLELVGPDRERVPVDVVVSALALPGHPPMAAWLLRELPRVSNPPLPDLSVLECLTRREAEVLKLLLDGWRVGSIGRTLYLSDHTVRNHLKAIYQKLGIHSQPELIDRFKPRA
jgi:DNA-binding CsgD family transcriptional regulator